jgi:hypothetical protein
MDLSNWVQATAIVYQASAIIYAKARLSLEPNNWKEVLKLLLKEREPWLKTIFSELEQLIYTGTFSFIVLKDLPKGCRALSCRYILKLKLDPYNKPLKYKARLIIRGFL